jgi:hypothetical protein
VISWRALAGARRYKYRQSDDERVSTVSMASVVGEGCDYNIVRAMGIDVGTRRIGQVIGDRTRTRASAVDDRNHERGRGRAAIAEQAGGSPPKTTA